MAWRIFKVVLVRKYHRGGKRLRSSCQTEGHELADRRDRFQVAMDGTLMSKKITVRLFNLTPSSAVAKQIEIMRYK
jgi:hypothetical protein